MPIKSLTSYFMGLEKNKGIHMEPQKTMGRQSNPNARYYNIQLQIILQSYGDKYNMELPQK